MATRSALVVVLSLVLFTIAGPVRADMERPLTEKQGVIVHFLFRRSTPSIPSTNTHYKASAPAVGLWHSPSPGELAEIHLDRSDNRQPEQTMPLLLVEW